MIFGNIKINVKQLRFTKIGTEIKQIEICKTRIIDNINLSNLFSSKLNINKTFKINK